MTARVRMVSASLVLLTAAIHGQEPDMSPPGPTMQSVVYSYSEGDELIYEVIRPPEQSGAAVAILVSGGCESNRSNTSNMTGPRAAAEAAELSAYLAEGFTRILVYHGNTGACIDALADLRLAFRHIRLHASEYGIDPDRIGVTGFSSGGMLALLLGFTSDSGNPDSEDDVERTGNHVATVVAVSATGDHAALVDHLRRNLPERLEGFTQKDLESSSELSANLYTDPSDPPTLLIHGAADERVPLAHAERTREMLSAEGVETDLIPIANVGHEPSRIMPATHEARLDWFRRYLLEE